MQQSVPSGLSPQLTVSTSFMREVMWPAVSWKSISKSKTRNCLVWKSGNTIFGVHLLIIYWLLLCYYWTQLLQGLYSELEHWVPLSAFVYDLISLGRWGHTHICERHSLQFIATHLKCPLPCLIHFFLCLESRQEANTAFCLLLCCMTQGFTSVEQNTRPATSWH